MADHNVTIVIRADATQVPQALAQVSSSYQSFVQQTTAAGGQVGQSIAAGAQQAAGGMNTLGTSVQATGGQVRTFASIAGMASAVLASFKSQDNVFAGLAAGAKTLVTEVATVMPVVLGVRLAMRAIQEGTQFLVSSFVDFDKEMTYSEAIMGDLSDTMKGQLADSVRQVAATTTFSGAEAAKGLYYIVSAGFDAKAAMEMLPIAARFAQAGMIPLDQATRSLMTTAKAAGLVVHDAWGQIDPGETAKNVEHLSDVMVQMSTMSNTKIDEMGQAWASAGGAQRAYNRSTEETGAALAVLADVGVRGTTAGTQLNMVWRDLANKGLKNAGAFKEMGIAVYDANGHMNDTSQILVQLNKALEGMSDAQRRAALTQLGFTDRSLKAILAIHDMGGEMERYEAHAKLAQDTTQTIADKQLTALSSQMEIAKNRVGNLASAVGEDLLGAMRAFGAEVGPVWENLVAVVNNAYETAKPFVELLVGLAGLAIWTPFKLLMDVLAPVTNFLKDHKTIVSDLIILWGLKAVAPIEKLGASLQGLGAKATATSSAYAKAMEEMSLANEGLTISSEAMTETQTMFATAYAETAEKKIVANKMFEESIIELTSIHNLSNNLMNENGEGMALAYIARSKMMAAAAKDSALSTASSVKSSAGSAISSVAGMATIAIIPLMNMMSTLSEADNKAKALVDSVTAKHDLNTFDGLNKSLHETYDLAKQADDAKPTEGWDALFATSKAGLKSMVGMQDEEIDRIKKEDAASQSALDQLAKLTQAKKNYAAIGGESVMSTQMFERSMKDLGLSIDITDDSLKRNKDAIVQNAHAMQLTMTNMPPAMQAFADESDANFDEVGKSSEKLAKDFTDAINSMVDPMQAFKESAKTAFDFKEIYKNADDANKQHAKDQEDAAKKGREAQSRGIDDQISAIEEQKKLYGQHVTDLNNDITGSAKGKKTKKEDLQDTSTAEKNLFDDRIDALRKQQQALQSIDETVKPTEVGFSDFMTQMATDTKKADDFTAGMADLRSTASKAGIEIPQAFMDGLKDLGPEKGGVVLQQMLDGLKGQQDTFVAQWGDSFKHMNEAPIDEWLNTVNKRAQDAKDMMANSMQIISTAKGGMGNAVVQKMTSELKDQAPQAIAELARLSKENPDKYNEIIASFDTLAKNTGDQATKTLGLIQTIQTGTDQQIKDAVGDLKPDDINQLFTDSGVPEKYLEVIRKNLKTIMDGINADLKTNLAAAQAETAEYGTTTPETQKKIDDDKQKKKAALDELVKSIPKPSDENQDHGVTFAILSQYISEHQGEPIPTDMRVIAEWAKAHSPPLMAMGGFLRFASGGEVHEAQIGNASTRVWNEPETGGEAYIPLSGSKRLRSVGILNEVAGMFGYGLSRRDLAHQAAASPHVQPIVVPVQSQNSTNFYGNIEGLRMNEVIEYADQKKRQAALSGGY